MRWLWRSWFEAPTPHVYWKRRKVPRVSLSRGALRTCHPLWGQISTYALQFLSQACQARHAGNSAVHLAVENNKSDVLYLLLACGGTDVLAQKNERGSARVMLVGALVSETSPMWFLERAFSVHSRKDKIGCVNSGPCSIFWISHDHFSGPTQELELSSGPP